MIRAAYERHRMVAQLIHAVLYIVECNAQQA